MEIKALKESDNRSCFCSGDHDLDRFFAKYAGQNQFRHHIGTTYVAIEINRILGFATVTAGHIEVDKASVALRKRFPRYPLPILRLARLAIDESAQNRGIGRKLLRYVFQIALKMSADYGCVGLVVDAKPEAVEFYSRFGFKALDVIEGQLAVRPRPISMFLSIREIKASVKQ